MNTPDFRNMEKKSYENTLNNSYDILANAETISNQFYLIQDDGDTLNKNKELQNVTAMQEVKGVIEGGIETDGCSVFDASSQQFYVYNIEPELLAINDQYAIPSVENNAYTVAYLIQEDESGPSTASEQIEPKSLETLKIQQPLTPNVEVLHGSKPENDLTEITLSDEQYHILEQKGWILLESSDKIFVLNTFGLHDITKDEKLIHILKNDLQEPELERRLRTESLYSNEIEEHTPKQEENKVEFILINNTHNKEQEDGDMQCVSDNVDVEMSDQDQPIEQKPIEAPPELSNVINEFKTNIEKSKCDSIKIKTKYNFKDIPDKIFLGKTVNGKKLFAKVTRKCNNMVGGQNSNIQQNIINDSKVERKTVTMNVHKKKQVDKKPHVIPVLDTARFINLIQESFRASSQCQVDAEIVEQMSSQVSQLMCLPNMRQSLIGANIVITKVVTSNISDIGLPTMITGTVHTQGGKDRFVHMPQMLQKLLEDADNEELKPLATKLSKDVVDLFLIQVSEAQHAVKSPQLSIHLSKRKLPLDVLKNAKKRHPNPIYACGSCGLIFKSEMLLKNHQNNQCLEVEDELTIDTDEISDSTEAFYSVTIIGKDKWYTCNICQARFSRLFNCQKHIGTHKASVLEKKTNVYKCKMCPGVYHHSSSLSKHIMKMHLHIQK